MTTLTGPSDSHEPIPKPSKRKTRKPKVTIEKSSREYPLPGKNPLMVQAKIWTREKWATHKGKKVNFDNILDAREFSLQNGYDGIRIELN